MTAAHVLVVTNRKGGTGKTTTAVNLAAEMAARGSRVLLVDLDTQGHCARGLGVNIGKGERTVHDLFASGASLAPALRVSAWETLHLLPADPLFEHGSGLRDATLLQQAFLQEGLRERYDLIVLDTPPSLDQLLLNALYVADQVLVPFIPHVLAGEGVRQLARVLFRVARERDDEGLRLLGLVPVLCDRRVGLHRKVIDGVETQFGPQHLLGGIRSDIRIAEAFGAGKPIRYYAPGCRGAEDYRQLADTISQRWQAEAALA
jgi:chromosome partitioning protein